MFLAASQLHCTYHQVVKRTKIAPLVNLSKACGTFTDLYCLVVQSNVHIALEVIARARRQPGKVCMKQQRETTRAIACWIYVSLFVWNESGMA